MTTPDPEVIAAAKAAQDKWAIPASVSIAQFALESGWGKHMPPGSMNPFGIKSLPGAPSVAVPTREYFHGRYVTITAGFAKFPSLAEAFDAHARLLAVGAPYAHARSVLPDPFKFVDALTGVYATDPNYGAELTAIIQGDGLTKYDTP